MKYEEMKTRNSRVLQLVSWTCDDEVAGFSSGVIAIEEGTMCG